MAAAQPIDSRLKRPRRRAQRSRVASGCGKPAGNSR